MKRKKILFVCTGNTCRSPMAEMMLRHKIKSRKIKWWDVASCGIHARKGDPLNSAAERALGEAGVAVRKGFAARKLTQKLMDSSVLVVTMNDADRLMLEDCAHVECISSFCGRDVPDPYGCGIEVYRLTLEIISIACDNIIEKFILNYTSEE